MSEENFTIQTKEIRYKDTEQFFKKNSDTLSITSVNEFLMLNDINSLNIIGTLMVYPHNKEMEDSYPFEIEINIAKFGEDIPITIKIDTKDTVLYDYEDYYNALEKYVNELKRSHLRKIVFYVVMDFISSSMVTTGGINEKTNEYEFYINGIQDGFVRSVPHSFKFKKNRYAMSCDNIGVIHETTKNNPWKLESRDIIKGLGSYWL